MSLIVQGGYDTQRGGTFSVTIAETGGGGASKTVTLTGAYLPNDSLQSVLVEDDNGVPTATDRTYRSMLAALNTGFSTGLTSAITWSIVSSGGGYKWRVTSNGAGGVTAIAVTFSTDAGLYFGKGGSTYTGALTHTLALFASRYMVGAVGGVTGLVEPREVGDELADEVIPNDGSDVEGTALPGAAYEMECVVPCEPQAAVWLNRTSQTGGTWEAFFRQVRNIEPITILTDQRHYVCKLKKDGCAFAPELLSANYLAYADIRLACWYFGELNP